MRISLDLRQRVVRKKPFQYRSNAFAVNQEGIGIQRLASI